MAVSMSRNVNVVASKKSSKAHKKKKKGARSKSSSKEAAAAAAGAAGAAGGAAPDHQVQPHDGASPEGTSHLLSSSPALAAVPEAPHHQLQMLSPQEDAAQALKEALLQYAISELTALESLLER